MNEATPFYERVNICPIEQQDKQQWETLYQQYANFYEVPLTVAITEKTWAWLMDPMHPVKGIVAVSEDQQLIGLAHYRACPDPLIAQDIGFLDDLYVQQEQRYAGNGHALLMAVAAVARDRGWPVVRWVTAKTNIQARRLYDKLAQETQWVTYDLEITR